MESHIHIPTHICIHTCIMYMYIGVHICSYIHIYVYKPQVEENNRMGKTRDLFKKMRDTKGTFPAKMGTIKDRNCMDLTEAEDIKKRWQEYTGELYKKDLHDPDNHNGVITHLEPDILE